MFHSGARACFIPGGIGRWVGPSAIPCKVRHYARTLKDWVGECWTHSCVRVLLIVTAINACSVCVWRPSANVPIGSVNLQVSLRWGVRGRGEWYWLNDLWSRLCSQLKECRYTVQRGMHSASAAAPSRQPPCTEVRCPPSPTSRSSAPPHRFAVGPAPQSQPNVMLAESSTPGNRLNP